MDEIPRLSLIDVPTIPQRDQDHLQYVMSAVKVGLAPWDPGRVTAYVSRSDHGFNPVVVIETELLPRLPFAYEMDLLSMDDHQNFAKMADEAFRWFRYRYAVAIDNPNIVLGEE
jgi:hypothetical protein